MNDQSSRHDQDYRLGVMSGTYDMTFDMTQASSYNPAFDGGNPTADFATLLAGLIAGEA
jgi:hypothetical protein